MPIIGSNSTVAQIYSGIQRTNNNGGANQVAKSPTNRPVDSGSEFALPSKATPRGDWVLSENANPQNFEAGAPRGTYLNVVV